MKARSSKRMSMWRFAPLYALMVALILTVVAFTFTGHIPMIAGISLSVFAALVTIGTFNWNRGLVNHINLDRA